MPAGARVELEFEIRVLSVVQVCGQNTGRSCSFSNAFGAVHEKIAGLVLAEPDEASMAFDLAVRSVPECLLHPRGTASRRFQNPDRKARFEFVMPALSEDPAERGMRSSRVSRM